MTLNFHSPYSLYYILYYILFNKSILLPAKCVQNCWVSGNSVDPDHFVASYLGLHCPGLSECGRDIISDKTKYMHSEDSEKLVYLSSLISLHLRYMGNEHNTSLSYL